MLYCLGWYQLESIGVIPCASLGKKVTNNGKIVGGETCKGICPNCKPSE